METQEYIKREVEARAKAELDARAILDAAADEKRDLSPEEDERFDRFIAESDKRKARIAQLEGMQKAAAAGAEVRAVVEAASGIPDHDPSGTDLLTGEIRSILETVREGGKVSATAPVSLDLPFDEKEISEQRAIANFSDAASLYVSDFSTRVAVYQRTMSPWLGQASVINATNGRPLVLPSLTVDPTSYTPGEGTAITESTPTLSGATATPISYKALSYISSETEDDEMIGVLGLIAQSQGRSLGLAFGSAATTAILAAATNGGTAAGTGGNGTAVVAFFGYEDLLDLKYGAAVPYRLGGSWVMANGAIKKVRKFKDGNQQYYWQPAVAAGQPDTFDGQPVYEDPNLAAPASATKSVVYGDLSGWVVKQMPLRVALSTEFRFNLDQVALRSVYRAGGALPDALALRFLVSATS